MIVTKIAPVQAKAGKGGNKYRIFLDGQLAFVLYRGELSRYKIEEGTELTGNAYEQICGEVLLKRAKLRCMHLMESTDRTEAQLRVKLVQGEYPAKVIEDTIAWLKQMHYLDDARYADMYIEYNIEKKSRRQIEAELQKKGVDRYVIEKTFEGREPADESALIEEWLRKKHYDSSTADAAAQRRMYGFLMRRGFSPAAVIKALKARSEW